MGDPQPDKPGTTATNLEQVSVPRLFFALLHKRFTGTLQVQQPEPSLGERTIWMRGGMPVFTDWVVAEDTLGQILLELGSITPQILTEALQNAAPDQPLGQALMARGAVDTQGLATALRDQCERKLIHLFKLRKGLITISGVNHTRGKDDEHWQVNVLELIQRGVSRHYDESRIVAELAGDAETKLLTTPSFAKYRSHFKFSAEDEVILQALGRGTHFQALINQPGINRNRAGQIAYMLWACQMLRRDGGRGAAAPQPQKPAAKPVPKAAPRPAQPPTPRPTEAPAARATAPPQPPKPTASSPATGPATRKPVTSKPAPAATPATTGNEDPQFMAELAQIEQRLADKAHAFDLLGVPLNATKRDIRRAWGDLSRRFHPDALQAQGLGHLRDRVEQVFASLSEAQLTLHDAQQREQLKRLIEAGGDAAQPGADVAGLARAALEAEVIARDADKLLNAGKFDRALATYERALALNDDEPDIKSAVLWCKFQLSNKGLQEINVTAMGLDAVIEEAPNLARAHYFRGMIHLAQDDERRALQAFNAAFDADPKLVDAQRQGRAILARRSAAKKKKRGLFGR